MTAHTSLYGDTHLPYMVACLFGTIRLNPEVICSETLRVSVPVQYGYVGLV